jgi:hypothetical protein
MTILRSRLQRGESRTTKDVDHKNKEESTKKVGNRRSQVQSLRLNRRRNKSSSNAPFIKFLFTYGWVGLILITVWLGGLYFVYHSSTISSPTPQEIDKILRTDDENARPDEQGDDGTPQEDAGAPQEGAESQEYHPKPKPKYQLQQTARSNLRSILHSKHGPGPSDKAVIDMRDLNRKLPFDNPIGGEFTHFLYFMSLLFLDFPDFFFI